jgi:hypothetical protein
MEKKINITTDGHFGDDKDDEDSLPPSKAKNTGKTSKAAWINELNVSLGFAQNEF